MEAIGLLPKTLRSDDAYETVVICFEEYTDEGEPLNKNKPTEIQFEGMMESVGQFLEVYYKYLGPVPPKTELTKIKNQTDRLLKTLESLDNAKQYENLIEQLTYSWATTRSLEARREDIRKQPSIITPEVLAICSHLKSVWWQYKGKYPTGTYDNQYEHDNDNPASQKHDAYTNPGAYFIQATLREYFGITYDNKQIKDLIQSVNPRLINE
jgi:hypothetical protein